MIPQILPDEILHGYRGRLRWVLRTKDVGEYLRGMGEIRGASSQPNPELEKIALANKLSMSELVCRHTHWSILKAIPPRAFADQINALAKVKKPFHSPYVATLGSAWFCPDCVSEDMSFWHFSYWRLSHHIPGARWCLKHQAALVPVQRADAFDRLPHHWMSKVKSSHAGGKTFLEFPAIVRHVETFNLLTDQPGYLDRIEACKALRKLAGGGEEYFRRLVADFTITALAHANLDAGWAFDTLNVAILENECCQSLCLSRGATRVYLSPIAIVLMATLLHESAEEAASMLSRFLVLEAKGTEPASGRKGRRRAKHAFESLI